MQRIKARLRRVPGHAVLRFLHHVIRGGDAGRIVFLRAVRPKNLFQPYPTTAENRYPREFQFVRARLGDGPDRRILSFGCATGEEIVSLGTWFPEAAIKGIDINPWNVAACRARLARTGGDPRLSVARAGSTADEPSGFCDAVFAMAVFRHGDLGEAPPPRCDHLIRFADFERLVADLARCLKPGGFLVIRHANFRFADTATAAGFDPVLSQDDGRPDSRTPLYGPDNRRLEGVAYGDVVFHKR